jgi:hypothetical protein
MGSPNQDLTGIVSSITSKYIQRIVIGFVEPVANADLRLVIKYGRWGKFDEAVTRLAEQTLNHGRKLQVELHVCGNPSVELFDSVLPRFLGSGDLEIVKTSYIWAGSTLYHLSS